MRERERERERDRDRAVQAAPPRDREPAVGRNDPWTAADGERPRWTRAIPVPAPPRSARPRDPYDEEEPAQRARRRGAPDDEDMDARRDGAELLRETRDMDHEAWRRDRDRGPLTRESFGLVPPPPVRGRVGD